RRHLMTAPGYRAEMTIRFAIWDQVTGQPAVA
ncbi:IS6 family transposase, partial [Streptomyces bottropensis]